MKARTELFLYSLLWTAETLARPTFRNVSHSFEGWAYRSGLSRQIAELEKRGFVERRNERDRVYRLTEGGRIRALGGRDPEAWWSRSWDRWWRFISFDVPTSENRKRDQLRHYLRSHWFGLLQRSLWITPDSLDPQLRLLRKTNVNARSLVLLQAQACGGESNEDLVCAAWNFDGINRRYTSHLEILNQRPSARIKNKLQADALIRWAQKEHANWTNAVRSDPLLPGALIPRGYLGKRAWKRRVEAFRAVGEAVKNVIP
jgi:DNA-binding transcriptional regulator PaaX